MKRVKAAVAAVVLAMWAGPASFAQVAYIPPGEQAPRFGGEFNLSEVGPVPGYWRTECYNWRQRSQSRRDGPLASSSVDAAIKRFVSGLIVNKPDYDDLSPPMAEAVRKHMPTYWASINRMGRATAAKKFDTDKNGNDLYVVNQRGGRTHWNLIVNPNGKITSAFMCQGEGL